jgi:hypothetical protein
MLNIMSYTVIEGSLEVNLPTSRDGKSQRREQKKKEDPGAPKGRKVARRCVFPIICGSGGSKNRLPKAAGAEPAGYIRNKKVYTVVA